MDGHGKPPRREPVKQAHPGATQHGGWPGDIVLWGRPGVAQSRAAPDVIPLYGVAPGEGVVVRNPVMVRKKQAAGS
jgi:hypothetical protein